MSKRHIPPVENQTVTLRALEESDLSLTLSWRNQEHIRRWFLTTDVIPYEKHRAWFERYQLLDNDFVFVILSKELNMKPVGQISLYAIDWTLLVGEYGRLMIGDPEARGKGLAKSASRLLLQIGFDILGLHEIFLEVKEDNFAAISVYKSIGFVPTMLENGILKMKVLPGQVKRA